MNILCIIIKDIYNIYIIYIFIYVPCIFETTKKYEVRSTKVRFADTCDPPESYSVTIRQHAVSTLPKALKSEKMKHVAEASGARRGKFSCSVREIFLHGAAGDSARGC